MSPPKHCEYQSFDQRHTSNLSSNRSAGTLSDTDWDIVCRATHFLNGHRLVFMPTGNGTTRRFQRIDKAPNAGRRKSTIRESSRTNLSGEAFSIKARDLSELGTAALDIVIPKEAVRYYPCSPNAFKLTANRPSTSIRSILSQMVPMSMCSRPLVRYRLVLQIAIFRRPMLRLPCESPESILNYNMLIIRSGGNLFSFSAGVKGGFSRSESDALASSQQSKNRTMNITYNVGSSNFQIFRNLKS